MSGEPHPIPYSELMAWSEAMRTPLHPDEVRAVRALDDAFCAFDAKRRSKPQPEPEDDD